MPNIKFNKLIVSKVYPDAMIPFRGSASAAAYDLFAQSAGEIKAGCREVIATGIAMQIPEGYYGQIFGRSGLAACYGLIPLGGVIDNDYRGEVKVMLYNSGDVDFSFVKFDRIAQFVLLPFGALPVVEQEELGDTSRGSGGFGSTGR